MAVRGALLEGIQGWLIAGTLAAAAPALMLFVPRIRKALGAYIAKVLGKEIKASLALGAGDPKLDEKWKKWVLATVDLAEYVIPDRGKGAERKAWVQAQLAKAIPGLAADVLSGLIEEAWESSDDVLKGTLAENPLPKLGPPGP